MGSGIGPDLLKIKKNIFLFAVKDTNAGIFDGNFCLGLKYLC